MDHYYTEAGPPSSSMTVLRRSVPPIISGIGGSTSTYFFFRGFMMSIYFTVSLYLIFSVRTCLDNCLDRHVLAIQISLCFVGITVPISMFHAWEHLQHFVRPNLQAQIVRIIIMVPLYSIEAFMSITYVKHSYVFQTIREIYEAYVIYCFMRFLLSCFGDVKGVLLAERLTKMPAAMGYHKFPYCWLPAWQMGPDFLKRCKVGVFQFVVVRFVLSVLVLLLTIVGCYEEGNYSVSSVYLWVTLLSCVSMSWALHCLWMFYCCCQKDLIFMRPFAKFICIKSIIFFTWFQGLFIGFLVSLGHVTGTHDHHHHHTAQEVADLIQDLLISMEMLVFAVAFLNSFPVTEFANVRQLSLGVSAGSGRNIATPSKSQSDSSLTTSGGLGGMMGVGVGGPTVSAPSTLAVGAAAVASIGNMIINPSILTGSGVNPGSNHGCLRGIDPPTSATPALSVTPPPTMDSTSRAELGQGASGTADLSPTRSDPANSPRPSSSRKVFLAQRDGGHSSGGGGQGGDTGSGSLVAWMSAGWNGVWGWTAGEIGGAGGSASSSGAGGFSGAVVGRTIGRGSGSGRGRGSSVEGHKGLSTGPSGPAGPSYGGTGTTSGSATGTALGTAGGIGSVKSTQSTRRSPPAAAPGARRSSQSHDGRSTRGDLSDVGGEVDRAVRRLMADDEGEQVDAFLRGRGPPGFVPIAVKREDLSPYRPPSPPSTTSFHASSSFFPSLSSPSTYASGAASQYPGPPSTSPLTRPVAKKMYQNYQNFATDRGLNVDTALAHSDGEWSPSLTTPSVTTPTVSATAPTGAGIGAGTGTGLTSSGSATTPIKPSPLPVHPSSSFSSFTPPSPDGGALKKTRSPNTSMSKLVDGGLYGHPNPCMEGSSVPPRGALQKPARGGTNAHAQHSYRNPPPSLSTLPVHAGVNNNNVGMGLGGAGGLNSPICGVSSSSIDSACTPPTGSIGAANGSTANIILGQAPLQALWTSTLPVELHEELQELGSHVMESYLSVPFSSLRKWVKGHSSS